MDKLIPDFLKNLVKFTPCEGARTATTIKDIVFWDGKYEGLILTTIKLDKSSENLKHNDKVSFTNASVNAELDSEAVFLQNVQRGWSIPFLQETKFTATYVSKEKAAGIIKKYREDYGDDNHTTMFCVHGCCGNIGQVLYASQLGKEKFKDYMIPVLWPTQGALQFDIKKGFQGDLPFDIKKVFIGTGYKYDWEKFAPEAGEILAKLFNNITDKSFGKISLLCHSMGNHLVFNAGSQKEKDSKKPLGATVFENEKFENIFMVGADVANDVFSENPKQSDSDKDFNYKKEKANNLTKMLKPGGKIYILKTVIDVALQASATDATYDYREISDRKRLGTTGATDIRKEFVDTIINIDVTANITNMPVEDAFEKVFDHLYQYDQWAVDLYKDAHTMTGDEFRENYTTD